MGAGTVLICFRQISPQSNKKSEKTQCITEILFSCLVQMPALVDCTLRRTLNLMSVFTGASYSYVQGQTGDEDTAVDVSLYSHRWKRWLHPNPRNMDSNRASQEQDPEPSQEEPGGFPGLLSAEDTDNSSQIEVGDDSQGGKMQLWLNQ